MQSLLDSVMSLINLVVNVLLSPILNGIQFFISTFANIPLFLMDILKELPSFMYTGITGVFGLLILVVILKLFALVK